MSTTVFASLEKLMSQPSMTQNVMQRFPFLTLWSPIKMESSLLMFTESQPTQSHRYLDCSSHRGSQHKARAASTKSTQFLRMEKQGELNYVHASLESKGYPSKFIQNMLSEKTQSLRTTIT